MRKFLLVFIFYTVITLTIGPQADNLVFFAAYSGWLILGGYVARLLVEQRNKRKVQL